MPSLGDSRARHASEPAELKPVDSERPDVRRDAFAGLLVVLVAALAIFAKGYLINHMTRVGMVPFGATAGLFASAVLVTAWTLIVPWPLRGVLLLVVNLVVSILVLSDFLYLRYFNDLVPMAALLHGHQLTGVTASVMSLVKLKDGVLFLDVVLGALVLIAWLRRAKPLEASLRLRLPLMAIALLLSGAVVALVIQDINRRAPHVLGSTPDRLGAARIIGSLTYHGFDAMRLLSANSAARIPKERLEAIKRLTAPPREPRAQGWAVARGQNLLIIQVEALQGFVVGRKVQGRSVMPHLDHLVGKSLYFPRVYSQVAGGNTSDSELMLNTSLYPAHEGSAFVRFAHHRYQGLAHLLAADGYRTVAMHANEPAFWNRYQMYPSLGFQQFLSTADFKQDERIGLGLSDRAFFEQGLKKLENGDKPFYSLWVTLTSHHPFDHPEAYGDFDVGPLEGTQLGNYLKSVNYVDTQLGALIERMQSNGRWEDTVVVIVGDHPAIRGPERDSLLEFLDERDRGPWGWERLQTVPLVIHLPGDRLQGRYDRAGGQVDIMPTVANLMGISPPVAFGRDLLNADAGFALLRNGSFFTDDYFFDRPSGRAFEFPTGRPAPLSRVASDREAAVAHREAAELVLRHDLVDDLISP